jgi:hypothetical protein
MSKVNGRFGGMFRLNFWGRRVNQAKDMHAAGSKLHSGFLRTKRRYIPEDGTLRI